MLSSGVLSQNFNFDFKNRDNDLMQDDLGSTVAKITSRVPDGLLIFFPSYAVMDKMYDRWHKTGVLS